MKLLKIKSLPEHYDSIDTLPMLNWNRIHKESDVSFLCVKNVSITERQKEGLKKVWEKIYKEYINAFGFGEKFEQIIEQKLKLSRLKNKLVITGDDSIDNFIRVAEIKLEEMEKQNVGGDIYRTKRLMEKHYGITISMTECSVREFYSALKDMKV